MSERITRLQAQAFTLTDADTWYRIGIAAGVSRLKIQPRGDDDVLIRFDKPAGVDPADAEPVDDSTLAEAAAWTLAAVPGQLIEEDLTGAGERVVYCASSAAGAVVEVLTGR